MYLPAVSTLSVRALTAVARMLLGNKCWTLSTPANIPIAKQKLPAEIAFLNHIIIGDCDPALGPSTQPHHCKVLDEFASQSTSTHQEYLQREELLTVT